MNSRHLVDPDLISLIEAPLGELSLITLSEIREKSAVAASNMRHSLEAPDIQFLELTIPGPSGGPKVDLLIIRPKNTEPEPVPAILYLHAGGYVVGTANLGVSLGVEIVRKLGCMLVSVNYRLSPEVIYPGALNDCYAALQWLYTNAADMNIKKDAIAVMGESAGGGLAASLGLLARDLGEVSIASQVLINPMIDDRSVNDGDVNKFVGEFAWTPARNKFAWSCLLGHAPGREGVSPYAAAARAGEIRGLPVTFISVGALDLFVEDVLKFSGRLLRAGVPTEVHVYPGVIHNYLAAPDSRPAKIARRDIINALERAFQ